MSADWDGPDIIWPERPPWRAGRDCQGRVERSASAPASRVLWRQIHHDRPAGSGRIFDTMDRHGLWDDAGVFNSLHRSPPACRQRTYGKARSTVYNPLGHIPLLLSRIPVCRARHLRCADHKRSICSATLADSASKCGRNSMDSRCSSLLRGETAEIRELTASGSKVHLVDKRFKYARAPRRPMRRSPCLTAGRQCRRIF